MFQSRPPLSASSTPDPEPTWPPPPSSHLHHQHHQQQLHHYGQSNLNPSSLTSLVPPPQSSNHGHGHPGGQHIPSHGLRDTSGSGSVFGSSIGSNLGVGGRDTSGSAGGPSPNLAPAGPGNYLYSENGRRGVQGGGRDNAGYGGIFSPLSQGSGVSLGAGFGNAGGNVLGQGLGRSSPKPPSNQQGGNLGPPSTTPQPSNQSQPSLLLNNLAQHLNNPPAPAPVQAYQSTPGVYHLSQNSISAGGGYTNGQAGAVGQGNVNGLGAGGGPAGMMSPSGGKLLLLPNGAAPPVGSEEDKIYALITELLDPETREMALLELSKKREMYEDLALVLWGGFGVMSSLLLEIVNVYPALSPPNLTAHASNRVCNALALLQCVASHSETRSLFLNAHIPLFLYPFLNTTSKTRPFEYLRLTSLGVVGALVKQNENADVINFLLSTEIIPLCLRIMETGSELSKTVAIFIVQKILLDDLGLQYICQTYERFYAVGAVLSNMVGALVDNQAVRLLKHVVRCYLRMSDNPRAREALRQCLPEALKDNTFASVLKGDSVTKRCLQTLLHNLNERAE